MKELNLEVSDLYLNQEITLNLSANFKEGTPTLLFGPSGCGKTTILYYLMGYKESPEVNIKYQGDLFQDSSVIFQDFKLVGDRDGYYNIEFLYELEGSTIDRNHIERVADDLKLNFPLTQKVNELSGGQKQKLAILRAVLQNRPLLLADEFTSNLDFEYTKFIFDYIINHCKDKILVIASHDYYVVEQLRQHANVIEL